MNWKTALRWSGYVLVAIAFAITCAFLSHWQFDRNAGRAEELALVEANYDADPVPVNDLIPADGALDPEDQWHPVTVTGTYLVDQTLLARNRAHGGTSAFEVLVPLQTADGRIFLVDRGWLPPGDDQPTPDAVPAPPAGEVTVVARLMPGEPLPRSGRSAPDGQVPTINLPLIADTLDDPALITGAYGTLVSEDPAPPTTPNPIDAPESDPGPFLSYAIQWILFAVMGFVFIWYMIRTEIRARREDAEDAAAAGVQASTPDAQDAPRPPRRRGSGRRRDRDMEEEDAMLDAAGR